MVVRRHVATVCRNDSTLEGINLFLADGEAAWQEVFHFHLHVFPRYRGDGPVFDLKVDWANKPLREDLDRNAELIRDAYDRLFTDR